jgi:hypothetical protein
MLNKMHFLLPVFLFFLSNALALTVEEYFKKRSGSNSTFLKGYVEAIYDNIYFFGGCDQKNINKRDVSYEEVRLILDIELDRLHSPPMEKLSVVLIPILLKTLNCKNKEAIFLNKSPSETVSYKEMFFTLQKEVNKNYKINKNR